MTVRRVVTSLAACFSQSGRFNYGAHETSFKAEAFKQGLPGVGGCGDVSGYGNRRLGGRCAGHEGTAAALRTASRHHARRGGTLRRRPVQILRLRPGSHRFVPARPAVCPTVRRRRQMRRRRLPRLRRRWPMRRRRMRRGPMRRLRWRRPMRCGAMRRMRRGPPMRRLRRRHRLRQLQLQLLPLVGRLPALLAARAFGSR
jgi:hypothetical protein